jgi:hypothetical protein
MKYSTPSAVLSGLIEGVTAKWAKQRKAEERNASARARRDDAMIRLRRTTVKEAAKRVMADAYSIASANGALPANPRQIYYRARGPILEMTGARQLDSQYFCQTLLIDYVEEYGVEWDIVWDDRGHFHEPGTHRTIGLGTLAVRRYLASLRAPELVEPGFGGATIATSGPDGRYSAVLFVEKEGFLPLLEASRLAERFDLAVMSSKGMSVTAARQLIDKLCVPVFVLHDFDIAGFSILQTLGSDSRRYRFKNKVKIIDLGLRMADVERLRLESEAVEIKNDPEKVRTRLAINGATKAEIEYLLGRRRVELNAMPSDVFGFLENKLTEHGVSKVVPSADALADAYRLFARGARARPIVEAALATVMAADIPVPRDLERRVRSYLAKHPEMSWDDAVAAVARQNEGKVKWKRTIPN